MMDQSYSPKGQITVPVPWDGSFGKGKDSITNAGIWKNPMVISYEVFYIKIIIAIFCAYYMEGTLKIHLAFIHFTLSQPWVEDTTHILYVQKLRLGVDKQLDKLVCISQLLFSVGTPVRVSEHLNQKSGVWVVCFLTILFWTSRLAYV